MNSFLKLQCWLFLISSSIFMFCIGHLLLINSGICSMFSFSVIPMMVVSGWSIYKQSKNKEPDHPFRNLTWKCEVCHQERPDNKISVVSRPLILSGISGMENIKYCNDREECKNMAETHRLFELRKMKNEN